MPYECCPRLEAGDWDDKTWVWDNKPFYAATYLVFFKIALNLDSIVRKAYEDITNRNLFTEPMILLHRQEAMFHSTVLISISEETDELPVETLSGTFYSRLYEGGLRDTEKHVKQMRKELREKKLECKQVFVYHATCPNCFRKRGLAQTVVFAQTS